MTVDPDEFFGTVSAQDVELRALTGEVIDPASGVRIVPPGVDLSTIKHDHTTSVRDVRTPSDIRPMEQILAHQLGVDPDSLRCVRAYVMEIGAIGLWEHLAPDGTVLDYPLAVYTAGAPRLRVSYARTLTEAEGRLALKRAELSDQQP